MMYKEYLNAARKHVATCVVLREALNALNPSDSKNTEKVKQLTVSLYYLSGYIIECAVKYGIYVCLQHGKEVDIKLLNTKGISFNKNIKHHKFMRYVDLLTARTSGIILIDNKNNISKEVLTLYDNWDSDVRYYYREISEKFKYSNEPKYVLLFNRHAEEIFEYIQKHIR